MNAPPSATAHASRIPLVDLARGVALVAMTAYHFCWDLEMFGIADRGFMANPQMVWSARAIAGSFLFLVGFSLFLAHGSGIRWRSHWKRLSVVVGAAGLITVATWFATPDAFIFFGILHSIALGSVLALVFLSAPWWLTAAASLCILLLRDTLRTAWLDAPVWWWTGLSQFVPRSNDYVPLFPFFGMILLGLAAAQMASRLDLLPVLAAPRLQSAPSGVLRFIGRHSLIYYLLHQPVMLAILFGILSLTGRI